MRTFSRLLSIPAIAGMIGAGVLAISAPALAQDHHHWGSTQHWHRGDHRGDYRQYRGGHWHGGSSVTFGFYGYPYDSGYYYSDYPYYGYYDYDCNDPYYQDYWSDYCD